MVVKKGFEIWGDLGRSGEIAEVVEVGGSWWKLVGLRRGWGDLCRFAGDDEVRLCGFVRMS